ncbi:MAG: ATPase, T2SS/T4P/T4SS family [Armatimonadota bacterium]|jgi:type IV pilus assembly protein PilB
MSTAVATATSRLGEILIADRAITEEELNQALTAQQDCNRFLGSILIDFGFATKEDIGRALERQLGVEFVDLAEVGIDEGAFAALPEKVIRRHRAIPFQLAGDVLSVAMADPSDLYALDEMRLSTPYRIQTYVSSEGDVEQAILDRLSEQTSANLALAELELETEEEQSDEPSTEDLELLIGDSPIVRLVDSIVGAAVDARASDIHLEPQPAGMRVRYRVDGMLYEAMVVPRNLQAALISRVKVLGGMDIAERRRPQDGHISIRRKGTGYDLRVSTVRTVDGEKAVIRLIESDNLVVSMGRLGLSDEQHELVQDIAQKPHGIVLVTGPTGSGKTTLLYSILNSISRPTDNIITIEDPVECHIADINQIQVNTKAGVTFAEGLRCVLRQDPNVIMVGEIRDLETAEIAIRSAMTGHLVFSTVHTNDAPGAITRLVDMGVEPFLVSSSLLAVIASRLVRLRCPTCARLNRPLPSRDADLNLTGEGGCPECKGVGYKGRTGIFEIMRASDEIRRLALEKGSTQKIRDTAINEGMVTLSEAGMAKVQSGETTEEEVARVFGDV